MQLNVWTHFVSLIFFIGLCASSLISSIHPLESVYDKAMLALFTLSACSTFLCSSLFHLNACHSRDFFILFGCLDYAGISALIAGSSISLNYFYFFCEPTPRYIWSLLILASNSFGIIGPLFPWWTGPSFRAGRAIVFISSGVLSGGPLFHFIWEHGLSELPDWKTRLGGIGVLWMACLYLVGVGVYVSRIPERWAPGLFDIWGHSHQLWHLFVTAAAYMHYNTIVDLMQWRLDNQSCIPR